MLDDDGIRHLIRTLRLRDGARVRAVERNSGQCFETRLTVGQGPAYLQVEERVSATEPDSPVASVIFAITKGSHPDEAVEKATELGVSKITIIESDHSVVRIEPEKLAAKKSRFEKIAEAASKQSKRNRIPKISLHHSVDDLLEDAAYWADPAELSLCCSLAKDTTHIAKNVEPGKRFHLWIGPEGDWSARELSLFREKGFRLVTLGPLTLRSETAAMAAVAMVNALAAEQ